MTAETGVHQNQLRILENIKSTELDLKIVLMHRKFPIQNLMQLSHGAILMFDTPASQNAILHVNDKKVAIGEVVQVNEHYGLRITEHLESSE